jgi:hypothetical protein
MHTTIRNLSTPLYKEMKALAALDGRTIGDVINEAMLFYVQQHSPMQKKTGSLKDLQPKAYGKGNKRLSVELDSLLYGKGIK